MERVAFLKPITDWVADGPAKLQFNVYLKENFMDKCWYLFCQLINRQSYLPVYISYSQPYLNKNFSMEF